MPEVPEVLAHAERLEGRLVGARLERFEPLSFTVLKTHRPPPEAASGRALESVGHRGKHLLLRFGDVTFVVHLMQGGRLREDTSRSRKPRGGIARWWFADPHPSLLLTEAGTERRAGVWVVEGDPAAAPPLLGLGPEAASVDETDMARLLAEHPMRLHTFLRDQAVLAGLGRRLANEICHRARLSPFARTRDLDGEAVRRVVVAVGECVEESLAAERDREDMSKSADRLARVHARSGQPCADCGDEVREVAYRDYTVNYCATCQTGGRILADNTTSKFLK